MDSEHTFPRAWITALGGDGKRHLARFTDGRWSALCGAVFDAEDTRHIIPRRCAECLSALDVTRGTATPAGITGRQQAH